MRSVVDAFQAVAGRFEGGHLGREAEFTVVGDPSDDLERFVDGGVGEHVEAGAGTLGCGSLLATGVLAFGLGRPRSGTSVTLRHRTAADVVAESAGASSGWKSGSVSERDSAGIAIARRWVRLRHRSTASDA